MNEIFTVEHKGACEYIIGFFTVVNKIGESLDKYGFFLHLDSALAHILAHIVYVLTTRSRSMIFSLFTQKVLMVESVYYAQIKF
jgi:hypothetical protein